MKNLLVLLATVTLLLGMAAPLLADELVSAKAGYQLLSPSGSFAGSDGGIGTSIDLEDDIDFDDSKGATAEIAFHLGDSRLSFSYLPLDLSGRGSNVDFTFNGRPFSVGSDSDIDIDLYEVAYTYYLLNFDDLPSRFQLGIEAAVKYADAEASITGEVSGITTTETVDGSAPIPTIGLRSRVALGDFIGVAGRVGYLEYDGNSFLDAEVQVEFSPLPLVGIYGGYRVLEIDIDESNLLVDATFEGPFVGVFARF